MQIPKPTAVFDTIILMTGVLTTLTDLRLKKIYNAHLTIAALLGLAAIIYAALWAHENILFHVINGLIALVIGVGFYRFDLWRGGDAKLFTLYAFLMPPLISKYTLFSSTINLFACSFIAGSIVILPLFIKDIIANNLISSKNLQGLAKIIAVTIFVSWVSFPVYHFAINYLSKYIHASIIFLAITYLVFSLSRRYLKKVSKSTIIIICGIIFGLEMRFWLSPESLTWPVLPFSILKIAVFSAISAFFYGTLENLKDNHDRIAFAPLLFTGCVLCYTPFLTWIMYLLQLVRR